MDLVIYGTIIELHVTYLLQSFRQERGNTTMKRSSGAVVGGRNPRPKPLRPAIGQKSASSRPLARLVNISWRERVYKAY